jgi:uncharacterized protein
MQARRILSALILVLVTAVATAAEAVSFGRSTVEVVGQDGGRHAFAVEMAATPEQLAQGLMYRRSLPAEAGMLFDFGGVQQVAMWMKNTLIPLDMLFIDRDGRIVYINEYAVPGSLEPRGPREPIRAVLEINAGTARRMGIRSGDRVEHPLFGKRN